MFKHMKCEQKLSYHQSISQHHQTKAATHILKLKYYLFSFKTLFDHTYNNMMEMKVLYRTVKLL